jgi:photosystem II stability/assembly factor-like uncharacterized protein
MSARLLILLGTAKGAFLLEGDPAREAFAIRGPFCEAMPVLHLAWDPATRSVVAGAGSPWYGPMVWRSPDLGGTWSQSSAGLTYGDDGPAVTRVWNLTPAHGSLYAGVEPAGLFRSSDGGETWSHVAGLREHPSRPDWQPGNGGLILHTIVPHPTDPDRMWIGISAVGVFETRDGGASWMPRNKGVRNDHSPDPYPELGVCVHKFGLHPANPERLYQQNHAGAYRTDDGGVTWQDMNDGLPSRFGFPLAVHPQDPDTIWTVPLNGDDQGRYMVDAAAAVWRSRDGGGSWERHGQGLPQQHAYLGVLREAMAVDAATPTGVYIGTSTGHLYGSRDEGVTWRLLAEHLPPISSVETVLLDA